MKQAFLAAIVVFAPITLGVTGCATDGARDAASSEVVQQHIAAFYSEVQQARQEIAALEGDEARFQRLVQYKDRLRKRAAAYDQSVVDDRIDPLEQQVYDELQGLLLTLNNIPDKPFSLDYCDIVRQSIYLAWAPNEPSPTPDMFTRSVREGLLFLDVLCAP